MITILNLEFLERLDQFLALWHDQVSCTRWGSSPRHQMAVNPSAPHSYHCDWKAVDLVFDNPGHLLAAAVDAQRIGFSGIEVDLKNNHLHLDTRTTAMWHVVISHEGFTSTLNGYISQHGGV